jgi:hypothetical protein
MQAGLKDLIKETALWNYYQLYKVKKKIKVDGIKYNNTQLFCGHNSEVLFIHIPKAAGMSIVDSLYQMNKSHHATAMDYLNEDRDKFNATFAFAITRNPYARLYSAYSYLKSGGMNIVDLAWWDLYLRKYGSFEQFITQGGLDIAIQNNAEHFIPQHKFIYNENKKLLCDYVGKIENIIEVENIISKKLKRPIRFTKKNVVNKSTLSIENLYTSEMLKVVNRIYELDFALLRYEIIK